MDEKEKFIKSVPCYKLNFDLSQTNISKLFDVLSKYGDILLFDGYVYIWLDGEYTKNKIVSRLKRLGITEIYCEQIIFDLDDDTKYDLNHLVSWWTEHFFDMYNKYVEKNYQEYLQSLNDSINMAKELIKNQSADAVSDNKMEEF